MIRMMESEWFPLLTILPVGGTIFSHIGLCPNHIDSFEIFNFIFGVDAGIIFKSGCKQSVRFCVVKKLLDKRITPASTPNMKVKISKESMWFGHKPMWEKGSGEGTQIRVLKHTSSCMMLLMMMMQNHDVYHGVA